MLAAAALTVTDPVSSAAWVVLSSLPSSPTKPVTVAAAAAHTPMAATDGTATVSSAERLAVRRRPRPRTAFPASGPTTRRAAGAGVVTGMAWVIASATEAASGAGAGSPGGSAGEPASRSAFSYATVPKAAVSKAAVSNVAVSKPAVS